MMPSLPAVTLNFCHALFFAKKNNATYPILRHQPDWISPNLSFGIDGELSLPESVFAGS
jgi:hypothetical protein